MIRRILIIAANTFRGVMSGRAVYIWGAGILLMLLRSAPAVLSRSTSDAFLAFLRAGAISGSLTVWGSLCIVAAAFIGANSVASETTSKVIVTILARPIHRWELLLGRWMGVVGFFAVTLAIGIVLAISLATYLDIEPSWSDLAIAATLTLTSIALCTAVAVVLSSVLAAGLAGALTVLLVSMPPLVTMLVDDPGTIRHRVGVLLDYAIPPAVPPIGDSRYAGVAWAPLPVPPRRNQPVAPQVRPVADFAADRKVAATALGYAGVYFVLGCVLFSRRDIRLG